MRKRREKKGYLIEKKDQNKKEKEEIYSPEGREPFRITQKGSRSLKQKQSKRRKPNQRELPHQTKQNQESSINAGPYRTRRRGRMAKRP